MKKKVKRKHPQIMIDLSNDDGSPGGANSVDAPLDPQQGGSSVPRSGVDPPSRPTPQDHVLIKGLKPIGIGDKDGRKSIEDEGEGDGRSDFFGGDPEDDTFEPERLRAILPGLIKVAYKMGAKVEITESDARLLSDQIIECALSDDTFRSYLDWLPTDCFLTVGVTAFMIYLRSKKEGKGNENRVQQDRERRTDGGVGGITDLFGGASKGAGGQSSDYKYSPDRLGKPGVWSGGDVWG